MANKRLFFALWPTEQQRVTMLDAIGPVQSGLGGRPNPRDNWHITLVFLGSVDEQLIPALCQATAGIPVRPFGLCLDRVSYWGRPKIACLEASHTPGELSGLVAAINSAIAQLGFEAEERRFRPHLTIARKVRPFKSRPLAQALELQWTDFELVESISVPGGVQYHPVKQQVRHHSS